MLFTVIGYLSYIATYGYEADTYIDCPDACVSAVEAPLGDVQVIGISSISQRRNIGLTQRDMAARPEPGLLCLTQHPAALCCLGSLTLSSLGLLTHWSPSGKEPSSPPGPCII